MARIDNHYDFLGLEVSASVREIRQALDVVGLEADALLHISPERSFELWERIRQIRHDLLEDRKRRQEYDTALLAANPSMAQEPHLFQLDPHVHRALLQARSPQPAPKPTRTSSQPAERRSPLLYIVGVAGALAVAAALAAAVLLGPKGQPAQSPVAVAPGRLTEHPVPSGNGSSARRLVHLRWAAVRGASRYRVQIASGSGQVGAAIFAHPMVIAETGSTDYTLQVSPNRLYAWRVQVYVRGRWTPYSPGHYFFVAASHVHRTAPHRPATRRTPVPQHAGSARRATPRHAARTPPQLAAAQTHPPLPSSGSHTRGGSRLTPGSDSGIRPTQTRPGPRPATRRTTTGHRTFTPPNRAPRAVPPSPPPAPPPTAMPVTGPTHPFGMSSPPPTKSQVPTHTAVPRSSTKPGGKGHASSGTHPFRP